METPLPILCVAQRIQARRRHLGDAVVSYWINKLHANIVHDPKRVERRAKGRKTATQKARFARIEKEIDNEWKRRIDNGASLTRTG